MKLAKDFIHSKEGLKFLLKNYPSDYPVIKALEKLMRK